MKKITLLFVVIMLVGFCFGLTASAQKDHVPENLETFTFDRQTPTLDGVIGEGEYSERLEMDGENKAVFFGKVRGNAVFYLAWDDEALYLAAEVKDDTLAVCCDENASVQTILRC